MIPLTHKQAHERLGGALGLHKLRELMNSGEIKSFVLGNKLMTTDIELDNFIRKMMESNSTSSKSYQTKHLVSN